MYMNTLKQRQNDRHFHDIVKWMFLNENIRILLKNIQSSLKFVPMGPFNNILSIVQTMALRLPDEKPIFEAMLFVSLTHICLIRLNWAKATFTHTLCVILQIPIWNTDVYYHWYDLCYLYVEIFETTYDFCIPYVSLCLAGMPFGFFDNRVSSINWRSGFRRHRRSTHLINFL